MASRFTVFGPTRVLIDGRLDDRWGDREARGMLAILLLRPGSPVTANELARWLRPDGTRPDRATFARHAATIRAALTRMVEPPVFIAQPDAYQIDIDPRNVDFFRFLSRTTEAQLLSGAGRHADARDAFRSAMDIWTARPLDDLNGPDAHQWRADKTANLWLPAQRDLLRELAALGEFDEVLRVIDGLDGYRDDPAIVKRRLEALVGLRRDRDAQEHLRISRRRLPGRATELSDFDAALRDRWHGAARTADRDLARRVPRGLPPDVTELVGRDRLLDELDVLTSASADPVLSLEGEPGIGKTAVALRWAHRAAHRFPGGQILLDLGGVGDGPAMSPADVVRRLLAEFDVDAELIPDDAVRVRKLRDLVSGRRAFVVLDDVRDSGQVLPLLDGLPCVVILTSRTRLTGLDERRARAVPVSAIAYRDATDWLSGLLGPRAAREPGEVAALAKLSEGNSMALRVIADHAVRKPDLSVRQLVDELRAGPAVLELGARGGTVRAAFATSYRALADPVARLFRLLGAHPGVDISVDAAAALAGQDVTTVRALLGDLADHHLLSPWDGPDRYRMHDLSRAFALDRTESAERRAAERRLLNFYHHGLLSVEAVVFPGRPSVATESLLRGVPTLRFADHPLAIAWVRRERMNILSALRMAMDREFHDYVTRMTSSTEILRDLGYFDDVVYVLQVALLSADAIQDRKGQADLHHNLGNALIAQRDFRSALSHLTVAKQLYDELGDPVGAATAVYNDARVWVEQGEYELGISGLHDALDAFGQAAEASSAARTLCRIAETHRRFGHPDEAIAAAGEAVRMAEEINDEMDRALGLTELCRAHHDKADQAGALHFGAAALRATVRLGTPAPAGRVSIVLALVYLARGDIQVAEQHAASAQRYATDGRDQEGRAIAAQLLGEIQQRQRRYREARDSWSTALSIYQDLADPRENTVRALINEESPDLA